MRTYSLVSLLVAVSALSLGACGGSQPAAEEPSASEPTPGDKAEAKTEEAAPEEKKEEKPASEPTVTRTAKDIITAPEVTFMFSFNQSEPKEKAEAKCSAEAKEDPKKMALCMKKASAKFEADGIQFKKNDKGDDWLWITVRRKGNTLTTLHKIPFTFADDKATSVTLKPTGKDTGTKPMKPPSEVVIEVPNEFQIVLKDPDFGKMVYEAKIGITSADSSGR